VERVFSSMRSHQDFAPLILRFFCTVVLHLPCLVYGNILRRRKGDSQDIHRDQIPVGWDDSDFMLVFFFFRHRSFLLFRGGFKQITQFEAFFSPAFRLARRRLFTHRILLYLCDLVFSVSVNFSHRFCSCREA